MIHEPLFLLFITVAAYEGGRRLRASTGSPLAQPALIAIVVVAVAIKLLGISYDQYRSGTDPIAFLLGPATVALAIPLHRQAHLLRGYAVALVGSLVLGAVVSVGAGVALVESLGGSAQLARTMAPKSATTPVSIALSQRLGGIPELSAVLTIIVGVLGAVLGPWLLSRLGVREPRARGLALGAVSHGIGTSRALHEDEVEGAFAGLSMGLTALVTCVVAPLLVHLLV
jgi:predicted murein hydrolase (TIGR00659 family)